MYLNFPSVSTVLASGGNALQFLFQWFVDFLEKLNFEFDTTEKISNEHAAARNLSNFHDARTVGSTVTQPIISRDAGQQLTEPTDHQLVIPPPDERITDTERSEAPVLYEYFSGIRIIRPPFTRETHRTEARLQLTESWEQLTEASDHQIMRFPRTSSRINGRDAVLLNTSSEDQTEPSDSQLVMSSLDTDYQSFLSTSLEERLQPTHHQLIRSPESRIPGRVEAYFRLSRSEEDSTEHLYHSELREQNQLTSREIESIPSTSRTYYTYPSQQSHSEDSIQHVPMLSYISKLFERSNGSADINQNYTKYQEIRQTVPKQIHISQTEQPYFTVHKELKEVSKRKGKVTIEQLRDTSKEKRA